MLALVLATLAAATPEAAEPRNVAILVLSSERVGLPISEVYAAARAAIETNTVLEVAPLDVFSDAVREDAIRECAGDGRCFAGKLRATGASVDLLLTVSAEDLGGAILLGLRLVDIPRALDPAGGRADIAAIGEEVAEGESLLRALTEHISRVFPPSLWGAASELEVLADRAGAEVTVGERTCVAPCKLPRLRPGSYEIVVQMPGFVPWRRTIDLPAGESIEVSAELEPESGAFVGSPLFWGLIGGVVAVGVGVALAIALQPSDSAGRICLSPSESLCPR